MGDSPADYLHLVPIEVWLVCWTPCSRRQLRRLSLVCQLFRSICLPLLLREQHADIVALPSGFNYSGQPFIDLARHMHRIAVRLDRLAEPPRVSLVRSWKFSILGYRCSVWQDIYSRAITTFSNTLGLYQNLRILHIAGLCIDKSFRQTLVSLPRLEDLTLDSCGIVARDGGLLRLKSFTIPGFWMGSRLIHDHDSLRIVSLERLHTLKIMHAIGESSPLLTDLTHIGQSTQLVELSLYFVDDIDLFFRFLKRCPALESLAICGYSVPRSAPFTFPTHIDPNTIPLLRNLTAPLKMVRLLTPHRPVCTVTVSDWQLEMPTPPAELLLASFWDISRASVSLRSLTVITPMTAELFTAIISLFPELQHLSIVILEENRSRFRCRLGNHRTLDQSDPPSLEFCDDEAFDNLPAEELSDDEGKTNDEPPRVVTLVHQSIHPELPDSRNLYNILNGICASVISLPSEITVFCLQVNINISRLSAAQEHQVVGSLSRLYPRLREVRIGFRGESHWEREGTGAVWKGWNEDEYIQVCQ
ncbi:hypothetical protein C8R44DRAFT_989158 [Mycena epipterygia]|nr:hypothetical protein C8R44DRAFT_989158 [Mycena epipterygia]